MLKKSLARTKVAMKGEIKAGLNREAVQMKTARKVRMSQHVSNSWKMVLE
jgi:hypothetical protein